MYAEEAYPTIDGKAAAMLESLLCNHALVDGNKRTSWTLMVAFLWINGWIHEFGTDEAFDLVVGIAEGGVELEATALAIAARRVAHPT